ncbi:MAG: hypothetical protein V3S64_03985, partial [bacterium]
MFTWDSEKRRGFHRIETAGEIAGGTTRYLTPKKGYSMKKPALILFLMVFAASAVFGRSSRENRGDSFIFVGYTPVGVHLATLLSQPLSLGVILGESLEIGVEFGTWEGSDNDDNV